MSSQAPIPLREIGQLTQARVPISRAAEAFATRDENGRIPIVVVPDRAIPVSIELILIGAGVIAFSLFGGTLMQSPLIQGLGAAAGIAILLFVIYLAIRLMIPEGVNALVARGGKYSKTLPPGMHLVPPWLRVTHLVSRREIPFAVPVEDAPTSDNVRARLITLVTLSITEPYRFVYNISADDFDLVFQAACQDSLRALVRSIPSEQINDLTRWDLTELQKTLSEEVKPYGVMITKIHITFAQPPEDIVLAQEARRLASYQRAAQEEQHALAVRRQADQEILAHQSVVAQAEREKESLRAQSQHAEMRKQIFEQEAIAADRRLALLEERLAHYPNAAKWEWQSEQLTVARALAENTRAIVQFGNSDELMRAWMMQDLSLSNANPPTNGAAAPETAPAPPPAPAAPSPSPAAPRELNAPPKPPSSAKP